MTAERFHLKHGCVLTVVDDNLDEQIRRLAVRAMDLGGTLDQKDATLRCLINHCESLRDSQKKTGEPASVFPL